MDEADPTWAEGALSMPFDLLHRGGLFGCFSERLLNALVVATGFDRQRLGVIYLITEAVALRERETANTSVGTAVRTEERVLLRDDCAVGITMQVTTIEGYDPTPRDDEQARRSVRWANGWVERTLQAMADHVDWEEMSRSNDNDIRIDAAELRASRVSSWRSIARAVMAMAFSGEGGMVEDPTSAALGTAYCEQEVVDVPHPEAREVVRRGMIHPNSSTELSPDPCAICVEVLSSPGMESSHVSGWGGKVSQLTCGHQFHSTCIMNHLLTSPTCPICRVRAGMPVDPISSSEENPFRIKRRRVD